MKYGVRKVGTDGTAPPSKPSRYPPGVDVSDPTKWFEKEEFVKLPPEWKRYCSHMWYESNQNKIKIKLMVKLLWMIGRRLVRTITSTATRIIINTSRKLLLNKRRNLKRSLNKS